MKIFDKLESMIQTLAQSQEDFHSEQREVNGKLMRAIHGEQDNGVPGLIKDMVYMKDQAKLQKNFRNKILWMTIGFGTSISFFEAVLHFKELRQLLK